MWVPCGSEREGEGLPLRAVGPPGHLGSMRKREKGEGEGQLGWASTAAGQKGEEGRERKRKALSFFYRIFGKDIYPIMT